LSNHKPKYPKGGYVYIVKPPEYIDTDIYKAGKTNNISNRMNNYNTSYPDREKKEFYKISKEKIIDIMKKCKKAIETENGSCLIFDKNESNMSRVANNELFGILSYTKNAELIDRKIINMKGGNDKINIFDIYQQNKYNYLSITQHNTPGEKYSPGGYQIKNNKSSNHK